MSDWIDWNGGECPVSDKAVVDYIAAADVADRVMRFSTATAENLRWFWIFDGKTGGDVVAYRIHKEN